MSTHRCTTEIEDGLQGGHGCGLELCENCATKLKLDCEDDISILIDKQVQELPGGSLQLRADVDFIHARGELFQMWL